MNLKARLPSRKWVKNVCSFFLLLWNAWESVPHPLPPPLSGSENRFVAGQQECSESEVLVTNSRTLSERKSIFRDITRNEAGKT